MATQRAKPYTITWPFTPKTAEDIDQTLDILFKQVELNAPGAGILPVTQGGTGLGVFTKGDLLYANTPTTIAGLHDVATGNVVLSGGVNTAPSYGKVGLTTHVSGVLPEANGGTNQSTYAQGDLIYASAANTLAKLAKDANATRYLSNTGASNAPAWAQVNLTNGVTGALPVANAGTNITSYTSGDIIYATGATTLAKLAIGAANRVLRSDGSTPNWGQVSDAYISDVTEAKITDGAILARVASTETISGAWTFTHTAGIVINTNLPIVEWFEADAAANNGRWQWFGQGTDFALRAINDAGSLSDNAIVATRSGATIGAINFGGNVLPDTDNSFTCGSTSFRWSSMATNILNMYGTQPIIKFNETDQAADGKAWWIVPVGGELVFQTVTDAEDAAQVFLRVTRSGVNANTVSIETAGTARANWNSSGHFRPAADNTYNCGDATFRWALVRGVTITPGDLVFANGWVVTEHDKVGIATPGLAFLDKDDELRGFLSETGTWHVAATLPLSTLTWTKTTSEQRTGRPRDPRPA